MPTCWQNEMFLDSASLRSSVVSHAKTLGYETTSHQSTCNNNQCNFIN